jgi:uncharacterized protein YbaR (Trm112 family)
MKASLVHIIVCYADRQLLAADHDGRRQEVKGSRALRMHRDPVTDGEPVLQ